MKLQAGHYYKSRDNDVWCCYRINFEEEDHGQARCIRVRDGRNEYFFLDGRYDTDGKREHCLIEEVTYINDEDLDK